MSKLPEYHQSAINMFLKCPKQYEFRYVKGVVSPPRAALTLGGSVDVAFTTNFEQKISTKVDLPVDDVVDAFSTEFERRKPETEWGEDKPDKQKDMGVQMVKVFQRDAAKNINPVEVQKPFRVEFADAGYAIGGTMDTVTEGHVIRDQKTSKTYYALDAVEREIQPAVYSFAYQAEKAVKPRFAFDVITKHKEPRYQEVTGQVGEVQIEQLFETINIMHSQIQRGEFQYAPPGSWWCSPDWCAYWSQCKGKKK